MADFGGAMRRELRPSTASVRAESTRLHLDGNYHTVPSTTAERPRRHVARPVRKSFHSLALVVSAVPSVEFWTSSRAQAGTADDLVDTNPRAEGRTAITRVRSRSIRRPHFPPQRRPQLQLERSRCRQARSSSCCRSLRAYRPTSSLQVRSPHLGRRARPGARHRARDGRWLADRHSKHNVGHPEAPNRALPGRTEERYSRQ